MKNNLLLGGLFLFVAILALNSAKAQCFVGITATDVDSFMDQIPSINNELANCPQDVPSPANTFVKNMHVQFIITGAQNNSFTITIQNSKITGISSGFSLPDYTATATEADFEDALKTGSLNGIVGLFMNKNVKITANGFLNKLKWFFAKPFIGWFAGKAQQQTQQTMKKVGDLCQHGGECETGNCIGIIPGQVYKCSCDPFKYVDADTDGNCPPETKPVPQTTGKKVGEQCNHGGECETGNCIGVVPGQLYKCSCDPYRYVDADTDGRCP